MIPKFCLWLITLSSVDGSLISERPISQPKPMAECIQLQAGRVSHAREGRVEIYECRKDDSI